MSFYKHGIKMGIERIDKQLFLSMQLAGKLTHEDYDVITPMIENALDGLDKPEVKAYVDCSELEGWEIRAAWDDLKLGLQHGKSFSKIAVVGNQKWLSVSAKVASWFTSGEVRQFESEQEALDWLL